MTNKKNRKLFGSQECQGLERLITLTLYAKDYKDTRCK